MNIGVDVDGVLVDIGKFQLEKGKKHFENTPFAKVLDPRGYHLEDIFGCSVAQRKRFWAKHIWSYWFSEPRIEGCHTALERLHRAGHRIVLITSRAFADGKSPFAALSRQMLRNWLKKNGIYYDRIVFSSHNNSAQGKVEACRKERIDLMIDDTPENLFALKGVVPLICYPAPWNRDLHDEKIIKVKSWEEISHLISENVFTTR